MQLSIVDKKNKKVGEVMLGDHLSSEVNRGIVYYAIKANRNNLRHGTAAVKDRSAVHMTNKKIYKQKGTGNARHGARSANIFVGGASAHGPRPRSYFENLTKSFKKKSFQEVFKYLIQNQAVVVLDEIKFDKPSTKQAAQMLSDLAIAKALVILDPKAESAQKSFRNLKDVKVIPEMNVNVYDLLRYGKVVLSAQSFEKFKERYVL